MSWLEQLVQTYEENVHLGSRFGVDGMKSILAPMGHILGSAQVEITLDGEGELIDAEVLPKEQQQTLLPCTTDSASRSGIDAPPHPLHDKLSYIARDYGRFVQEKKSDKKPGKKSPHEQYVDLLGAWVESPYVDPKVRAVYRYITEHDVIDDLLTHKILYKDKAGHIIEKWTDKKKEKPPIFKASGQSPLQSVVRFRVDLEGDSCP